MQAFDATRNRVTLFTMANGRIVTFYSYKGGVGRSMALSNFAWLLASNGKRVLAIDWDLEAPGLANFFHPFLVDPFAPSAGLLNFLCDVRDAQHRSDEVPAIHSAKFDRPDLLRYAMSVRWSFPFPGSSLDIISAGQAGPDYARRVSEFNWAEFYRKYDGYATLEHVREQLRSTYDYVLIDSRTGVNDTAGICTVQMADDLVICTTMNWQNINGAAQVAESVLVKREKYDRGALRVFPVVTRVESSQRDRLEIMRQAIRRRFDPFLSHLHRHDWDTYFADVEIPYVPFLAYEEILCLFAEDRADPGSVTAAIERLGAYLTNGEIKQFAHIMEAERLHGRNAFLTRDGQERPEPASCMISYSSHDREFAEKLSRDLRNAGVKCWFAPHNLPVGAKIRDGLSRAIETHDKVIVVLSSHSLASRWVETEVEAAFEREDQLGRTILLPLRLDASVMNTTTPWAADVRRKRMMGDFSEWRDRKAYEEAFRQLIGGLSTS